MNRLDAQGWHEGGPTRARGRCIFMGLVLNSRSLQGSRSQNRV